MPAPALADAAATQGSTAVAPMQLLVISVARPARPLARIASLRVLVTWTWSIFRQSPLAGQATLLK